jgi:hypothetical protein
MLGTIIKTLNSMKTEILIVLLILMFTSGYSQTIETISTEICDSISTIEADNKDPIILNQIEVYSNIQERYLQLLLDSTQSNYNNQINVINYKLIRQLNRSCPDFQIKNSTLLGLTTVIDIEDIFTPEQLDSIHNLARKFQRENRVDFLIVTIDDLFPYDDFKEYADIQLINWKIGFRLKQSKIGVIIVFSKKMRYIRISSNDYNRKYLIDAEYDKIINEFVKPEFIEEDYLQGIFNCMRAINNKI